MAEPSPNSISCCTEIMFTRSRFTKQKVKKERRVNAALEGLMLSDMVISEGVPCREHIGHPITSLTNTQAHFSHDWTEPCFHTAIGRQLSHFITKTLWSLQTPELPSHSPQLLQKLQLAFRRWCCGTHVYQNLQCLMAPCIALKSIRGNPCFMGT